MNTITLNNNKTKIEKIDLAIKIKFKAENDIVLYWHYQSIKDDLIKEIKDLNKRG